MKNSITKPEKINRYRRSFKHFGTDPRSLGWKNNEAQKNRFLVLLKDLDLDAKSILDFGCGMGDIIPYISAISNSFEYIGVDVVSEFIRTAMLANKTRNDKSKSIKLKFKRMDFLKNPLRKKSDIILCSGALNSNIKKPMDYRKKAIQVLWDNTNEALAFNMAGGHPQPVNKKVNRIYYADSLEILSYCFTLTSKIIFRHHYRKCDFTITMFR